MKAIVCGAGQVGKAIAKYLSEESYQVVVIDIDKQVLLDLESNLDVQTIQGNASVPMVLENVEAKNADLLIAVTGNDEVNMVTCLAADSLFNIPMKMGRLHSGNYTDPLYEKFRQALHMDVVIAPELEIARKIVRNLKVPGALDLIDLGDKKAYLIALPLLKGAPLIGRKVIRLNEAIPDHVVALGRIVRGDKSIDLTSDTIFEQDDIVYFLTPAKGIDKVLSFFGCEMDVAKDVVIFGGGRIGFNTARLLEEESRFYVTLIERDEKQATHLAKRLPHTLVVHGNGMQENILEECRLSTKDVAIATTNDDEDNILLSLLAKKHEIRKTLAVIYNTSYCSFVSNLGVDVIVDPNSVSISTIIGYIRKGLVKSVYSLGSKVGDVMEITALETSKVVNVPFSKIKQYKGVRICAVIQKGELIVPFPVFKIKKDDTVIVFVEQGHSKDVDKMFSAGLFFF